MIDFHIHIAASPNASGLLPTEALRLARRAGYRGIGLIVRSDSWLFGSSMPSFAASFVAEVRRLSLYAGIDAFAGIELVDIPPALIPDTVAEVRSSGIPLLLGHGESLPLSDRDEPGVNLAFIRAGVDILAHPGLLTDEDAALAAERGIFLELSTAPRHSFANGHLVRIADRHGASLVLNSNARFSSDFPASPDATRLLRNAFAIGAGLTGSGIDLLRRNSFTLAKRFF